jgi:hypothetical protein
MNGNTSPDFSISPHPTPHSLHCPSTARVAVSCPIEPESLGRTGWWTVGRTADQALSSVRSIAFRGLGNVALGREEAIGRE